MGGKSTTTSSAEPWSEFQPYLKDIGGTAQDLFNQGGFAADPYSGRTVAGFSDASKLGMQTMMDQARQGGQGIAAANSAITDILGGSSGLLDRVGQNALGSAIPAAASMFSGSGMANSSAAMDTVGRAATEAIAPIQYNAIMNAAGLAPQLEQASYMPAQMMNQVGMMRDLKKQQKIDARVGNYYERQNQAANNLAGYNSIVSPIATMGGSSESQTTTSPGIGDILGMGLQILGLFSDRRLKTNIREIGEVKGHRLYAYNYVWSPTIEYGVMADEVPHAVAGIVGGYAVVDYGRL